MKYRELLNNIIEVAKKHPNINSTFIGDVYELNHRNDVDYCAFVITQGTHRVNSDEDYIDYTLNLFYVDRLTADESNRTQIHSSGIDFMNSLLRAVEKLGVVVVEHTENVFNERFNDVCAGVYATVVFRCEIDECGQTIEIITPDELKVLEVKENGTYNGLFKQVDVNVQGGGKEPVLETLNVKDNGTYRPNTGVDGFDIVEVNIPKERHNVVSKSITANGVYNSDGNDVWNEVSVNVPQKTFNKTSLTKEYTANGQYSIATPDGYDGISDVNLTVNVPSREPVLESLSITDNGTYTPSSGVDGYNSVEVNVPKEHHNVVSKSITSNGVYNSTGDEVWNRVDVNVPSREPVLETLNITENGTYTPESGVDGYNSVTVNVASSGSKGFDTTGITNIDNLYNASTVNSVNMSMFNFDSVKSMFNLFYNSKNLENVSFGYQKFPKNCDNTVSMFGGCTALKDTNVSDWFNPNVEILSMNSMFEGCSQLTSNISFHNVKFKRDGCYLNSVFDGCSSYTGNPFQYYNIGYIYPKDTSYMFKGVGSTTLNLVRFDFTYCTKTKSMFEESKVTDVGFEAYYDQNTQTNIGCQINSENLTDVSRMFYNTPIIAMELTFTSNANITNVTEMFYNCINLTRIRLDGLVGSKVTTVKNMLYNVNTNIELSIKNWDVSGLSADTNLGDMFGYDKDMYIGHQTYSGTVDMSGWGQLTTNNVFTHFFECFSDLHGINLDGTTFADETFAMLFNSYDNTDAVYTALFNALPQSTNGSTVTIDKDTSVPRDILQIATNKNWKINYARYWA